MSCDITVDLNQRCCTVPAIHIIFRCCWPLNDSPRTQEESELRSKKEEAILFVFASDYFVASMKQLSCTFVQNKTFDRLSQELVSVAALSDWYKQNFSVQQDCFEVDLLKYRPRSTVYFGPEGSKKS